MLKAYHHEVILRCGSGREIRFEHANHDNLLDIVARVQAGSGLTPDDAAALAIGLKLLAEVAMLRRDAAPYDALWPALATFTRALKALVAAGPNNLNTVLQRRPIRPRANNSVPPVVG